MSTEVLEAFVGRMTVSEFCQRTGHSVEELLALSTGSERSKSTPAATEVGTKVRRARVNSLDLGSERPKSTPVATEVGTKVRRARVNSLDLVGLDERVMTLLTRNREGVGGRELADAIGTTLPLLRASLKRLLAAKRVRFSGQTRARRYWAT